MTREVLKVSQKVDQVADKKHRYQVEVRLSNPLNVVQGKRARMINKLFRSLKIFASA